MNFAKINEYDIANGDGVRVTLFVCGCNTHCKGCHNEMLWDFNHGKKFTAKTRRKLINALDEPFISGLTILGGEPLDPRNIWEVLTIVTEVKQAHPDKTIWLYTGYTLEQLKESPNQAIIQLVLKHIDVIVDGPYIEDLRDISLFFQGSSNQRIIENPIEFYNSIS